jgi:hypothetical protein
VFLLTPSAVPPCRVAPSINPAGRAQIQVALWGEANAKVCAGGGGLNRRSMLLGAAESGRRPSFR